MIGLKENVIVCHVVCKSNEAHQKLETLSAEYGNDLYIDWEQSKTSYYLEMKQRNDELANYGQAFNKTKINKS